NDRSASRRELSEFPLRASPRVTLGSHRVGASSARRNGGCTPTRASLRGFRVARHGANARVDAPGERPKSTPQGARRRVKYAEIDRQRHEQAILAWVHRTRELPSKSRSIFCGKSGSRGHFGRRRVVLPCPRPHEKVRENAARYALERTEIVRTHFE